MVYNCSTMTRLETAIQITKVIFGAYALVVLTLIYLNLK